MVLTYLAGFNMMVFLLMATTYSDSPYCQWEWFCESVHSTTEAAEEAGQRYLARFPDEEVFVIGKTVEGL